MQPQEQTLPVDDAKLATLQRWMDHQVIVDDVLAEREAQFEQFGDQELPLGTDAAHKQAERYYREQCQLKTDAGTVTYLDVLLEEVYEFAAETDEAKARDELIQVLAVGFQIVQAMDRKASGATA